MKRELEAFVRVPTPGSFLAAFRALLAHSQNTIAPEDISNLLALLEGDEHEALTQAIAELPPLAALSPAIHWIAAEAAQSRGDRDDYELEQFLLTSCLSAILGIGDGSAGAPYLVPCAMDERYVCAALGLVPESQALVNRRGRAVDVVQCSGGTAVCFDVSSSIALPARQAPPRKKKQHSGSLRGQSSRCSTSGPSSERTRLTRTRR